MSETNIQTASASSKHKKNLLIVLSFSGLYLIAEVIGGIITNSLALLADAAHMLTDVDLYWLILPSESVNEKRHPPKLLAITVPRY